MNYLTNLNGSPATTLEAKFKFKKHFFFLNPTLGKFFVLLNMEENQLQTCLFTALVFKVKLFQPCKEKKVQFKSRFFLKSYMVHKRHYCHLELASKTKKSVTVTLFLVDIHRQRS